LYHPFGAIVVGIVFLVVVGVVFINKTSESQTDLNEPNQLQQAVRSPLTVCFYP